MPSGSGAIGIVHNRRITRFEREGDIGAKRMRSLPRERSMRSVTRWRTSVFRVRSVPVIYAEPAMMLRAVPP
jgi:hypothetical protein